MSNMEIITAAMIAMRNKKQIAASQTVGCYYCLRIFPAIDVKNYTDNGATAICPHCHVDSIIPEKAIQALNETTLKEMQDYWFNS